MINIQNIDHVVLRVRDLETMMRFYIDVLGARTEKHQKILGLYQLRVGDIADRFRARGRAPRSKRRGRARQGRPQCRPYCFRVLPWDGEAVLAHLRRPWTSRREIVSRYGADGDGPSVYLTDPEGNNLELKGPPWAPVPKR